MAFKQGDPPVFKIGDLVLLEGIVEETRDPGNIVVNLSPKGDQTHHLSFHRNVLDALDLSRGLRQSAQDEEPVLSPTHTDLMISPEAIKKIEPPIYSTFSGVPLTSSIMQVSNFTLSGDRLEPPDADAAVGAAGLPDGPDPVVAGNAAEILVPESEAP